VARLRRSDCEFGKQLCVELNIVDSSARRARSFGLYNYREYDGHSALRARAQVHLRGPYEQSQKAANAAKGFSSFEQQSVLPRLHLFQLLPSSRLATARHPASFFVLAKWNCDPRMTQRIRASPDTGREDTFSRRGTSKTSERRRKVGHLCQVNVCSLGHVLP
jgi:hypothetical protein